MKRWSVLVYGLMCYASFLASFLYLAGWLGNIAVPRSIDAPPTDPWWQALLFDMILIVLFGLQHSLMARPRFKRWWTQWIPAAAERSTYVLCTSVALLLLFWQWRPLGGVVWELGSPLSVLIVRGLFAAGWSLVVMATFWINHFDLFGLRQVWLYFRKKPYVPLSFSTPGLYRFVRHPLYVGWLIAFWATPVMTLSHLLFAAGMTAYIFSAIPFEERDLGQFHGSRYRAYQQAVGKLIPRWRAAGKANPPTLHTPRES